MRYLCYLLMSICIGLFIISKNIGTLGNFSETIYAKVFLNQGNGKVRVVRGKTLSRAAFIDQALMEQRMRQEEIRDRIRSEKMRVRDRLEDQRAKTRERDQYFDDQRDSARELREAQAQRMADVRARYEQFMDSRRF